MFQEFQKYTTENLHGCILNIDLLQGKIVVIILPNHCYVNICFIMTNLLGRFNIQSGLLEYKIYNDL